jgi:hypothetical protein
MDVTPRVFLLGVIDEVVHVARQRPIAPGRVGIKATARLHGDVSGLLYRLDGKSRAREIRGGMSYQRNA